MNEQKLHQALRMVVKAKKYFYGQRLKEQLKKGQVFLILTSSDMGMTSKKQLNDKAKFYEVKIVNDVLSTTQLTSILNQKKPVAAIGITDLNLARLVESYL